MDFNNFNLIKKSENAEMYFYQQELLNNIDYNDGENAIKLALLMTLSPIGDYEEALKILTYSSSLFSNVQLEIIKCYLMLKWGDGFDVEYIKKLISENKYDAETESVFYYLIALQFEQMGMQDEMKEAITTSVEKCTSHVNNLLMYAKYSLNNADFYLKKANSNYKDIVYSDITSYANPSFFIGEHISGIYS